ETGAVSEALGQRCTVRGNPPVTTGCNSGESCAVVACTNTVPPTCFGTCRQEQPPPKNPTCEGAFNCLCGTPTCVDGEWTCVGSCRPGGGPVAAAARPSNDGCEGAFDCLC